MAARRAYLWYRILVGDPLNLFDMPHIDPLVLMPAIFFVRARSWLLGRPVRRPGRSPHAVIRPEQIDVRLDDVVGIDVVKDEVVRSLQLFLAHRRFAREMGGRPRRGLLFEGGPGTGKTYTAKALAAEAGVPFLFATATSFQSGLQGATARKVRNYFQALRKAARKHGGAVGFIDEFDAIGHGPHRHVGHRCRRHPRSPSLPMALRRPRGPADVVRRRPHAQPADHDVRFTGGGDLQLAVNELLVQMQSFEEPTGSEKLLGKLVDAVNLLLPAHRQLPRPVGKPRQHPAHRLDQPRRRARPGPAAARPLRPAAHLRAAAEDRPPRSSSTTSWPARRTTRSWTPTSAATPSPRSPRATARRCSRACCDEALVQAVRGGGPG